VAKPPARAAGPLDAAQLASERPVWRVSVKRSARDDNLYVVRKLAEGQAPPPGSHEALLVLVDPDEALVETRPGPNA
jgi:hypothetical protein